MISKREFVHEMTKPWIKNTAFAFTCLGSNIAAIEWCLMAEMTHFNIMLACGVVGITVWFTGLSYATIDEIDELHAGFVAIFGPLVFFCAMGVFANPLIVFPYIPEILYSSLAFLGAGLMLSAIVLHAIDMKEEVIHK